MQIKVQIVRAPHNPFSHTWTFGESLAGFIGLMIFSTVLIARSVP